MPQRDASLLVVPEQAGQRFAWGPRRKMIEDGAFTARPLRQCPSGVRACREPDERWHLRDVTPTSGKPLPISKPFTTTGAAETRIQVPSHGRQSLRGGEVT